MKTGRWYIVGDPNRADFWTPEGTLGFTIIRKRGIDPLIFQTMVNTIFCTWIEELNTQCPPTT